jgi:hypothetical protein
MSFEYKQFRRRKLPHIHPPGAILFVTFRLTGSIPKTVLAEWKAEKAWLEDQKRRVAKELSNSSIPEVLNHQARLLEFHRRWFRTFEDILHKAEYGPTWLKDDRVAKSGSRQSEVPGWSGLSARCLLHHVQPRSRRLSALPG